MNCIRRWLAAQRFAPVQGPSCEPKKRTEGAERAAVSMPARGKKALPPSESTGVKVQEFGKKKKGGAPRTLFPQYPGICLNWARYLCPTGLPRDKRNLRASGPSPSHLRRTRRAKVWNEAPASMMRKPAKTFPPAGRPFFNKGSPSDRRQSKTDVKRRTDDRLSSDDGQDAIKGSTRKGSAPCTASRGQKFRGPGGVCLTDFKFLRARFRTSIEFRPAAAGTDGFADGPPREGDSMPYRQWQHRRGLVINGSPRRVVVEVEVRAVKESRNSL